MFELTTVTKVALTNVNPRPEFHGDDRVRAVDISIRVDGANQLLDLIEPGLLVHHYTNRAAAAGQDKLPEMLAALPNLRHPKLPTKIAYGREDKPVRGYRLEFDWGLGDRNPVLEDCVLPPTMTYEIQEGGSVSVHLTLQYNGEALEDDAFHGRICGMAGDGSAHITLLAPVQPIIVKGKLGSWRSGQPEVTPTKDGGAPLFEKPNDGTDDDVVHAAGSPEAALAGTEPDADPDPQPGPEVAPARRGRKAADRPTAH